MSQQQQQQEQEFLALPSELKFPQDKDTAGPAWWGVIHNIAAKYPHKPSEFDKRKMKSFLDYLIQNFVCMDCVKEASDYMKKNRVDLSSKNALSKYFCEMHNEVNKRTGKEQYDCDSILDGSHVVSHDSTTCTTCNVKNKEADLKSNLEDFKTTSRNLIMNLCKEENITPPNIHFQPCPDKASTSCITYNSTRMKDGIYFGDADIYINPYSASLRTVAHETKHYIDLKKGTPLSEVGADNYAIDKINTHFNFDTYKNEIQGNNKQQMDSTTPELMPQNNDVFDRKPVISPPPVVSTSFKFNPNIRSSYDYPSLNRLNNMLDDRIQRAASDRKVENPGDAPSTPPAENVFNAENNRDFILSSLNSLFAFPASLVGVSPASLNMSYTGSFINNVLMYLINSNLSTFGAATVTFVGAISLFTGAAIFKNAIGQGDRGFIQGMVAMFLTSGINSLTPQKRGVMAEGLRLLVDGVRNFDLMKIREAFFFDEDAFKLNKSITGDGGMDKNAKKFKINPKTGFRNDDVSNALSATASPYRESMGVSPIRGMQLASQKAYDVANNPSPMNYMSGDKNTIPNYSNSSLESVANSYARKRNIFGASGPSESLDNLDGIDMDQLTEELTDMAGMEVDSNTYEVLQL